MCCVLFLKPAFNVSLSAKTLHIEGREPVTLMLEDLNYFEFLYEFNGFAKA
jgi:hypothetical protein